jgi:DNA repair exonuclease SbcCD ATPase subunit
MQVNSVAVRQNRVDATNDMESRKQECIALQAEIERAEAELQRTEANPYADSIDEVRRQISAGQTKRKALRAEHDARVAERDRVLYWVKGFRDLRLWILDSTLAELEAYCNNSLIQLGLERWSMRFAVDRETKSGGVARGFNVLIESPDADADTPWKSWGGGVGQRLRLAAQMGLASLINSRKQFVCAWEVWDEPTAHLSRRGVIDLLTHLQARSIAESKAIFVVDHRSLAHSFDGQLVVTKTFDGAAVSVR